MTKSQFFNTHPFLTILFMMTSWILAPSLVQGGVGSIPLHHRVQVYHPQQRAFIVWNGTTEILVLSSNISAEVPGKVLEVVPFPSKPEVKQGYPEFFDRAINKINQKLIQLVKQGVRVSDGLRGGGGGGKPIEVKKLELLEHKKIGAHDIFIIEALAADDFVGAVEAFLEERDLQVPDVDPEFRKIVSDYIRDGYRYFSFDIIDVTTEPKTVNPIQYTFQSDHLFYPLRIGSLDFANLADDQTAGTQLIVLTDEPIKNAGFVGLPARQVVPPPLIDYLSFPNDEINAVSPDFPKLFPGVKNMTMRVWDVVGEAMDFRYLDIVVKNPNTLPQPKSFTEIWQGLVPEKDGEDGIRYRYQDPEQGFNFTIKLESPEEKIVKHMFENRLRGYANTMVMYKERLGEGLTAPFNEQTYAMFLSVVMKAETEVFIIKGLDYQADGSAPDSAVAPEEWSKIIRGYRL